jgi:hypothetical protein
MMLPFTGRKFDKYGRNEGERCKIDMILDGTEDWRMAYAKVCLFACLKFVSNACGRSAVVDHPPLTVDLHRRLF